MDGSDSDVQTAFVPEGIIYQDVAQYVAMLLSVPRRYFALRKVVLRAGPICLRRERERETDDAHA